MTTKERARQVIQSLPDDASMDDIIRALYIQEKCERGDRQIEDGHGIAHHEIERRFAPWVK